LKAKKCVGNHFGEISDMAGMFYSLKDAAEKLKKTQEELKQLVKQGKLREFRDGAHLLFKIDEVEALMADTSITAAKEPSVPEIPEMELPEMEIPETAVPEQEMPEIEIPEAEIPGPETPEVEAPAPAEHPADTEEISLAPETGIPIPESELTSADTALTSEGISVLGETDRDYQVTDDTLAETTGTLGTTGTMGTTGTGGTTPEPSLEEIEEDVSMDTFGSGSGLLDLSLQADDTSLGAILDEIYSAEGAEAKEPAPAKSGPPEEAEQLEAPAELAGGELPEDELVTPQSVPEAAAIATAYAYIEPEPDVISKTLGILLFLPLALFIYTAVMTVGGLKGVLPLAKIQGAIWYIMIGVVVITGVAVGAAFMLSRPSPPAGAVAKKEKKAKPLKKSKKGKESPPPAPEETSA